MASVASAPSPRSRNSGKASRIPLASTPHTQRTRQVSRSILDEDHIHPAIRDKVAGNHADIVREVQAAIAANGVVVVGMKQNPMPKKARKALDAQGIPYKYLEYGSYFNTWRRRNALKMWTGWPTFPMVFVKGVLIGGAADLDRLIASGELARMLSA
jgi:monothiol glutaredoxin